MLDITEEKTALFERIIEKAGKIGILTHSRPDGDAMGSTMALLHFLHQNGKDATIFTPNGYQDILAFICDNSHICNASGDSSASAKILGCDTLFCLDFNVPSRTDINEAALRSSSATKVLIDHHLNPEKELFQLVFSAPEASSTCELLFNILIGTSRIGGDAGKLPGPCIEALLTGLTTDTNNFANSTTPLTLKMASELMETGVDRDKVIMNIYFNYPERRLRAMSWFLYNKLKITGDGVGYMVISREDWDRFSLLEGETEGLVNKPLEIDRVKISILLRQDGDLMRVSVRSKKGYSANRMAMLFFNGGGHENASGGKLTLGKEISSPAEGETYIERVAAQFMQENK